MGIKLIELLKWLECNSILDLDDEIRSITVDEKKQMVAVTGTAKVKDEEKRIGFSDTFDAIRAPVQQKLGGRGGTEERRTILKDDESEDESLSDEDIIRDAKDKEDIIQIGEEEAKARLKDAKDKEKNEQIRDHEHKGDEEDGKDKASEDKS